LSGVRHLYVHVPFCAHRCGYCDFVTVVGRSGSQAAYVDALLAELRLEHDRLASRLETIYLGGGTPTYLEPAELVRLLRGLPPAQDVTVEANPETVTPQLARLLAGAGVTRVSVGAQSFRRDLLAVLERQAAPDAVRRAVYALRDASFDNTSLDLVYGIPGQSASDLAADLAEAVALAPEHISCYELEAKPGTRFTHAHGAELAAQAEAMEGYFEQVVETLTAAGYRWYETANFCRPGREARHNLAVWRGEDYLGIGIGAVSTLGLLRRRNRPGLHGYLTALAAGHEPPRELERLPAATRLRELLMLRLRLDEPVALRAFPGVVDVAGLARMAELGLVERTGETIRLTPRGRFLGGAVTVELLAEDRGGIEARGGATAGRPAA
jgi:oxygen-independent coproporphyrinogen-3 oxidase